MAEVSRRERASRREGGLRTYVRVVAAPVQAQFSQPTNPVGRQNRNCLPEKKSRQLRAFDSAAPITSGAGIPHPLRYTADAPRQPPRFAPSPKPPPLTHPREHSPRPYVPFLSVPLARPLALKTPFAVSARARIRIRAPASARLNRTIGASLAPSFFRANPVHRSVRDTFDRVRGHIVHAKTLSFSLAGTTQKTPRWFDFSSRLRGASPSLPRVACSADHFGRPGRSATRSWSKRSGPTWLGSRA